VDDTKYQGTKLLDGNFEGTFQVGSVNDTSAQIYVSLDQINTTGLGLSSTAVDTMAHAQTALDNIDDAIDSLAEILGNIGASMNRLDYTYSNLQVQIENFSAAESVIRDVDMASEMVTFTKSQILLQAGTAMLAQANMSTQSVLSLFR